MKSSKHSSPVLLFFLFVFFSVLPLKADAKTIVAPTYKLINVTHAKALQGGFVTVDGKKKFQRKDGSYLTSRWVTSEGSIYYLDKDGNKFKGWVIYRGKKYRVKGAGLEVGRIFTSGGKKYYANDKGYVVTNSWITLGKSKYYAGAGGALMTGEHLISGKWYYFKKNGEYKKNHTFKNGVNPSKPMIALTFDDGPGPYTDRLLDCLSRNHARATFFMVGTSVPSRPSTIRRMVQLHCQRTGPV